MIEFLVRVSNFISRCIESVLTTLKIVLLSRRVKGFPLAEEEGISLVILGNGPSLKDSVATRGDFIRRACTLAVNNFASSSLYGDICPKYYVIIAVELFMDDVSDDYKKSQVQLVNDLAEKTKWELTLFLPHLANKSSLWRSIVQRNPLIRIVNINITPVEGFDRYNCFLFQRNLGMPRPHNVLIPSILIAINMRFCKVYLFGADHSWLKELSVDDDNKVLLNQKHFYDEQTSRPEVMRKKGKGQRNIAEILIKFVHAFNGYYLLEGYARSRGVKILNATPGSFIDAFERDKG